MGWRFPPFYGKDDKKIDKKIAKIDRKIKNLSDEKAIYEEQKAKLDKKETPKA